MQGPRLVKSNVASSALEKGGNDNSSTGQGNKRDAFPAKFPGGVNNIAR